MANVVSSIIGYRLENLNATEEYNFVDVSHVDHILRPGDIKDIYFDLAKVPTSIKNLEASGDISVSALSGSQTLTALKLAIDPRDPNGPGVNAPQGTIGVLENDAVLPDGSNAGTFGGNKILLKQGSDPKAWRVVRWYNGNQNHNLSQRIIKVDHNGGFAGVVHLGGASKNKVYNLDTGDGSGTQVFKIKITALGVQKADTGANTPEGTPERDCWVLENTFMALYRPTSEGGPSVDTNQYQSFGSELGPSVDGVIGGNPPNMGWVGAVIGSGPGAIPAFVYFIDNGDANVGGDSGRTVLWRFNVEVEVAEFTDETLTELDWF